MVSNRKIKQQSRKLHSQIDVFKREVSISTSVKSDRQNVEIRSGQVDLEFTSVKKNGTVLT